MKARLHLSGTLQIAPNNITVAVADGVVQIADDLFNSGNIPVAGIPRLPGLVRNYDEFAKTADVLRPYLEKSFGEKGVIMLADYTYPLQVIWGKKKLTSLEDIKGLKLRVAQPEQGEMVRRFGGTSVTISAPEVPSALDRGVVDGIFTAGVGAVLWKDLLKYGFLVPVTGTTPTSSPMPRLSTSFRPSCKPRCARPRRTARSGTRIRCGPRRPTP